MLFFENQKEQGLLKAGSNRVQLPHGYQVSHSATSASYAETEKAVGRLV